MLAAGLRRAIIAFVAGAASALAIAPINAWPVLFLTFPILVWLVDGSAAGRLSGPLNAALAGWCFGFGYFLAGLYWIGYAFLVDVKTFGWLLPVAVTGLPAYLALYTALGLAVARLIWLRGPERLLALAAAMTTAEWLRGHLLSGFPWNTFGYALTEPLVLAQSVSLVGIWTLTFLCLTICATPAVLADDKIDTRHPYRPL
ncbi:MAG: apolipoprotein N-acyltransferase, partial [Pseudolabrys sp.]